MRPTLTKAQAHKGCVTKFRSETIFAVICIKLIDFYCGITQDHIFSYEILMLLLSESHSRPSVKCRLCPF